MNLVITVGLMASLLASALLLDFRNVFYVDWNNHLWIIGYFGECLRHFFIPDMLNTQQLVSMPITLFYAQKFYALSGVLSALVGSAVTIRIMVLAVLFLQFIQVYRAAIKAGSAQNVSLGIAVMVTWAIYPLTNLYNRCALPEFFAVAFLTCAVASFLLVVLNTKGSVSKYDYAATGLFFVAAAVTHPLTALFGGLFLGILGVIALFFSEGKKKLGLLRYFSIIAFFSLLILSPWIYVVSQFNDKLPVSSPKTNAVYFHSTYFFPRSIDNILSRLSPFPLDLKSIQQGVQDREVFTPYIDAQITLPLILLIGVFIYIGRRGKSMRHSLSTCERAIIGGSSVMLVMFFTESVCPKTFDWLGGFFNILQFPYRLVTYVNLSALGILIILAGRVGKEGANTKQIINICLGCCIALSFSGLIEKLVHGAAIAQKSTKLSINHLNELPATFYGASSYAIKEGFEKGTVSGKVPVILRNFNVLDGARFGQVEAMTVNLTEPALVITNVQAFPWNHILINGSTEYPYSIIAVGGQGAVLLPQGNYHLEATTLIDSTWRYLNLLSWVFLLGWITLVIVFAFKEEAPWAVRI